MTLASARPSVCPQARFDRVYVLPGARAAPPLRAFPDTHTLVANAPLTTSGAHYLSDHFGLAQAFVFG